LVRRSRAARLLLRNGLAVLFALVTLVAAEDVSAASDYSSPQAIEAAFQDGLQALKSGDNDRAIRIFRGILAARPDLPRVRLELARAYFQARQWERSRREFFAVLSGDVPRNVKMRIVAYLRAIDARRGFDWDLSVGFSTSPQSARDYDSNTVLIDVLGIPLPFRIERDKSGAYGVQIEGAAEYRMALPGLSGDSVQASGFGRVEVDLFEGNGGGADDYLFGIEAGLRGAWPSLTTAGSLAASKRDFGGRAVEDRLELRGTVEWRDPSGLALFASAAAGMLDDHQSEGRDGAVLRGRMGIAQSFGGRGTLGVAAFAERQESDADFESYTTGGIEAFGITDLGFGVDAAGSLFLLNQEFDARIPGLLEKRDEWEYGARIELTKTDVFLFGQFSPFVQLGFTRRESSLDAFSYNEYSVSLGVRKAF
jgi:hypothetical protein